MGARKRKAEAHVRLYRHETECPAWRTLSADARALLIEIRSFYAGRENRIHYSTQRAMDCLHTSNHHRARRALAQLLARGWIIQIERGSFSRKSRKASVYALGSEPLDPSKDGATAPKAFMRWKPGDEKILGGESTTVDPLTVVTATTVNNPKSPDGGGSHHRGDPSEQSHGGGSHHTVTKPCTQAADAGAVELLNAAQEVGGPSQSHILLCVVALVWSAQANQRRAAA